MTEYPNKVLSFARLSKDAFRLHYLTLKHTIICIILITITKYITTLLLSFFSNTWLQIIIQLIALIVITYFFAAALLLTHRVFIDRSISTKNALALIWRRIIPIMKTLFAYLGGIVVIYYVMKLILFGIQKLIGSTSSSIHPGLILFAGVFSLVFVMMFYFSFAISVIDEKPLTKTFYDAAVLGEKEKTGVLILFVVLCAILILLTPATISEYFLSIYHLGVLFDFVVLSVVGPLYINLLLLTIHNAKQQI